MKTRTRPPPVEMPEKITRALGRAYDDLIERDAVRKIIEQRIATLKKRGALVDLISYIDQVHEELEDLHRAKRRSLFTKIVPTVVAGAGGTAIGKLVLYYLGFPTV